jgi:uncharacterized protein YbbC (DUF1343 family)
VLAGKVEVGTDRVFLEPYVGVIKDKNVGLVTNQTGVNAKLETTLAVFEKKQKDGVLKLKAIFTPEHGLFGAEQANEEVHDLTTDSGIPIYSLYGKTRRPTKAMLQGLDVIVYDIQDIGSRPYTYTTTLYYVMEEAAKYGVKVVVLDRPNPIGGKYVDGPMVDEANRSFLGYINVPYCHGMTVGELAKFFNEEYHVGCALTVVPMFGWRRWMRFEQTGLCWIPTSPNVPEPTTPCFFPAVGLMGELQAFGIGGGCSLPFKIVTAPWIDGEKMALFLKRGGPAGIKFHPTQIKPVCGRYQGSVCGGVLLLVTDWEKYNPIQVQFWLLDVLKRLYPAKMNEIFSESAAESLFDTVAGTKKVREILLKEKAPYAALIKLHTVEREKFMKVRQKYLIPAYSEG